MASEYGWTMDQIFKLTSREVFFLLNELNNRRIFDQDLQEIERGFQASMHGAKYTPQLSSDADTKGVAEFSEEQEDIIKKHLERRLESMKQRGES